MTQPPPAAVPAEHRQAFARLLRLLQARRGKFQFLVLDCRDERLRNRLIAALDTALDPAAPPAPRLHLTPRSPPDFAAFERDLLRLAAANPVVHVTGGPAWFSAERWASFNIRREAVARQAKAALLFWLDPDSIALLAATAIDLWAWRGAVLDFIGVAEPLPHAALAPDIRVFDTRAAQERHRRIAFLEDAVAETDLPDDLRFPLLIELGDLRQSLGDMPGADAAYRAAVALAPDARAQAVTLGRIADVLEMRGELDEAFRIRREEQLPVYDRIGAVRERAVTMGRIADALERRGELDEALRIRREEVLPVYDRIGDIRARAVTMGGIADVLEMRGELDEALRIRREEVLPVFDRIGDARARAVTMGRIADVLQRRGELDEALRIHREEQLPVYDRIGDARARAVTMGRIADVLQMRGELDEALRMHREEQLPVFDRIGDARERANTLGGIADVLQRRGELDEALRIRREEQLPVYDRLGDARARAITLGKLARTLIAMGALADGRGPQVLDALQHAHRIAGDLRMPDVIGFVNYEFARACVALGQPAQTLAPLAAAEQAFTLLGDANSLAKVRALRATLDGSAASPDPD